MALAAMPVLYVVQDPSPCDLSDYPDDCIVNFSSNPKLSFWAVSFMSFSNDNKQPEVSKVHSLYKPRPSGGLGIEFHAQKKIWASKAWRQQVEFYSAIFQKLSERGLLRPGFKALCVGAGSGHSVLALWENGLPDVIGIDRKSFASLVRKGDIHRLPFVFSALFDRALVPPLHFRRCSIEPWCPHCSERLLTDNKGGLTDNKEVKRDSTDSWIDNFNNCRGIQS